MHFVFLHLCKDLFDMCVATILKSGAFFSVSASVGTLFLFLEEVCMQKSKSILFNTLGVVLGAAGGTISYFIAYWILFDLIPLIPLIPSLLSWPVDYEWYALTGVLTVDIFVGIGICAFFCNVTETKYNYGVIILSVINVLRYLNGFIQNIVNNGFSFSLLFAYGFAFACIFFAFYSGLNNNE